MLQMQDCRPPGGLADAYGLEMSVQVLPFGSTMTVPLLSILATKLLEFRILCALRIVSADTTAQVPRFGLTVDFDDMSVASKTISHPS